MAEETLAAAAAAAANAAAAAPMLKEILNAFIEVSDDDLPTYFRDKMNDIFSLQRQDITVALAKRDNNAILHEIRNDLLAQATLLFPELTDKKPIRRIKTDKLCEDIYILGHCILVKQAHSEPDSASKSWLISVYKTDTNKTTTAKNNSTTVSQSILTPIQSPPVPIQNNSDVMFPNIAAFDPFKKDDTLADVSKLRKDLDEITILMMQTKQKIQDQSSQQGLRIDKLDTEISRLDKEHEWLMTSISNQDTYLSHYFSKLENYITRTISDEITKAVTQQTAAQENKINTLNAEVDRLQNMVHSLKPPTPLTTSSNLYASSTPTQQNQVIGLPTSNPPQQANNRSAWLFKAGSATAHGGKTLTHHKSPPVIPNKPVSPRAQKNTNRENGPQQQQQPPQQPQNNPNVIKRGPKKVDQIFISQVGPSYNCKILKDHIHDNTGIDKEHILVDHLFNKNCNQAFKITVPHGKMQDTIRIMGTEIKAEQYKENSQRSIPAGQARGAWSGNAHRKNNKNTFPGPPPNRRPPPRRQPNQHPYQQDPSRRGYNQRQQYSEPNVYSGPYVYSEPYRYYEPYPDDRYYQNTHRY